MPVLTVKTTLAAGGTSAWTNTDGVANIIVGVDGVHYDVQYNLGSDIVYSAGGTPSDVNVGVVVAKANQVRVYNRGTAAVDYEVFS